MIAVAVVAVGALAAFLFRERAIAREREAWTAERRELLNRIQQPQFIPASPLAGWEPPETQPDEIGLVGTVTYDPEYVGD